jgi:outer membrane protein
LTFTDALELARKNDPTFMGARADYQAAQERSKIAFSALLPQLNISGNTAQNDRKYVTSGTPETTDAQKFNTNNAQINLTQALWRRAERIASTQAGLAAQQGEDRAIAAEHDLFVRFLQAWFDVMSARDNIYFTAKQSAAAGKLRDQTNRAAELGLASEPELEDARARYEKAMAEQTAAETDEETKISSLEQIIGPVEKFAPPTLSEDQPMSSFPDKPLSQWLDLAENSNPGIMAAIFGVRAANEEIRKQRAGHDPTLDITGSYGRTAQGAGTTPTQQAYSNTQGTIGLQLNIPVFSGGGQSAKVREAIALREKSAQDLENARRGVRSACKQAWFGIQSGIARQKAATQAVKSASASLRVATTGKEREVKTDLDVLQATQQLYGALRDLQNARYEIMLNKIKLKAAAGQLTADDVVALNAVFAQPAGSPEPPADRSPAPRQASPVALANTHE